MMIIVIVMIAALRYRHSTLDLQKNNKLDCLSVLRLRLLFSVVFFLLLLFFVRSEPLPAIQLSSITGEAEEEDLDSHAYDYVYKYNKTNSQPAVTHPPTLPPMPASRNGGYKLTTCPAYAPTDIKNIPSKETKYRKYEIVVNTKPSIPPLVSASRNGEYELTTCPAYAPTNIQSKPSKETKDGYYEIVVNTKPTILPSVSVSRNGGYEMTTCPAYAPSDIQSSPREETEDRL